MRFKEFEERLKQENGDCTFVVETVRKVNVCPSLEGPVEATRKARAVE